jgi:hypothetical protein
MSLDGAGVVEPHAIKEPEPRRLDGL